MAKKKTIDCGYEEFIPALTEKQIKESVNKKSNVGIWRDVTYFHKTFSLPDGTGDKYAVVFVKSGRIGLDPAKVYGKRSETTEEGEIKTTKGSWYEHCYDLKDKKKLIKPIYFVRKKTKKDELYVQIWPTHQKSTLNPLRDADGTVIPRKYGKRKTKVFYYKNGVLVDPIKDPKTYDKISRLCPPTKAAPEDAKHPWILPVGKIIEIK